MTAVDPTYGSNALVGTRGQFDYLEISFKPATGSVVTWERVPLVSELGAFSPESQDAELRLFVDAAGSNETLRASRKTGGRIAFSTAAHVSNATVKKLIAAADAGTQCVYRAHYSSMGVMVQGRTALADRGMQGGTDDIPTWGFELLVSTAQYVNKADNTIISG